MVIDEMSFNQYPAYLIHKSAIEKVEVLKERCESRLPRYSLRYE
jgi:hypothetical protein